ncbi:Threonine synthase-like 1 [Podila epigama]|nr:Threonine synthase-like 1 [Podila epigama]
MSTTTTWSLLRRFGTSRINSFTLTRQHQQQYQRHFHHHVPCVPSATATTTTTTTATSTARQQLQQRKIQRSMITASSSSFLDTTVPQIRHSFSRSFHLSIRTLDQKQKPPAHDTTTTNTTCSHDHDYDHNCTGSTHTTSTQQKTQQPLDDSIQPQQKNPIPPNTDPKARMLIGFTCTVCQHRSHKTMSKHAYTYGVVIMQCDHCKNRHLIADHLGWFKTGGVTVEDLVKEKGETVKKLTRQVQLIKDGQLAPSSSASSSSSSLTGSTEKEGSTATATTTTNEKSEFELALEKAGEGMLEWVPKEIIEQEAEKLKKSQSDVDHSLKK